MQLPIFSLDPLQSVKESPDAWIRKLSIEVVQMMATFYTTEELAFAPKTVTGDIRSNKRHLYHPITKWAQLSYSNFMWAFEYGLGCIFESFYRNLVKSAHHEAFYDWVLLNLPTWLPDIGLTPFYKPKGYEYYLYVTTAYQQYFCDNKQHIAVWTKRDIPRWYLNTVYKS